jgi:outer membrane biosynthesis protein TonB
MWRDIILSMIGHAVVLGTLILPSFLSPSDFKPVTVVSVKTVSPQSISQLLQRSAQTSEPMPKVPQVDMKQEKVAPNPDKKTRKVQTVKRAEAEPEKAAQPGTAGGKNKSPEQPNGITTEQNFTDFEYLNAIAETIRHNWRYPTLNAPDIKAVVYFQIARDGSIRRAQVKERTKYLTFDISAYEAVVKSAPFPPLPDSYSGSVLGIFLRFTY